jgi:hypothetical protein
MGFLDGTFTKPMAMADGTVIQVTAKKYHLPMATLGHWNKQGVMDEEYLFWDNATLMRQIGSASYSWLYRWFEATCRSIAVADLVAVCTHLLRDEEKTTNVLMTARSVSDGYVPRGHPVYTEPDTPKMPPELLRWKTRYTKINHLYRDLSAPRS